MRPPKLDYEAHAELDRVAELKVQIPPYKQLAERYGVTVQTIRQKISALMRSKPKRYERDDSRGTSGAKIEG